MTTSPAINIPEQAPDIYKALHKVHETLMAQDFDVPLYHLVQLRASQINGCGFCVKMHTEEARRDGENNDRLDRLIVWRHVDDFTDKEKAALAWTEALTYLDRGAEYAPLREELRKHFSEAEIATLTSGIAMINLWNRLQISGH